MKIENRTNRELVSEVERVLKALEGLDPSSDEYTTAVENLRALYDAQSKKPAVHIEWSQVLTAGVYLLGLGLTLWHEQLNVITTKTFSWTRPPKI